MGGIQDAGQIPSPSFFVANHK